MQFLNAIDLSGIGTSDPSADILRLYRQNESGRQMLAFRDANGLPTILQPHMGLHKVAMWTPAGISTLLSNYGANALTATGTATGANQSSTNIHTQARRIEFNVATPATDAIGGFRAQNNNWWRGDSAGLGGFHLICQWGPSVGVSTSTNRSFVGMSSSTAAPTDVEPSSLTNMAGMGWDSADTNIQLMTNDGSGSATKIDLGSDFPVPTQDRTKFYELQLFCPPNSSELQYQVSDIATGKVSAGTLSSDLIPSATFISPRGWVSAGGTSSAIGISLFNLYIETSI